MISCFKIINMNEIANKFLLAGDRYMPEMHLKQPGFTYRTCGPFPINNERIQKFKETGDTKCNYINELDKACFQHDMAYGDFKDLARTTTYDKVLRDKSFNSAKNPKYDGYQRVLASIVYIFFDKKPQVVVLIMKLSKISNWLKNYTSQLLKNF